MGERGARREEATAEDCAAAANARGLEIHGQIRGRPTSTRLSFELSENPFRGCPFLAALPEKQRICG